METDEIKNGAKFFDEMARRSSEAGLTAGAREGGRLPLLLRGRMIMAVTKDADVWLTPECGHDSEAGARYHAAARLAQAVMEYTSAVEQAPPLKAEGLSPEFKLLAEFNGAVLAGRELKPGDGYEFATWNRDHDGQGVNSGHFFCNAFEDAKQDFTVRSGLIPVTRLYTDDQLTEVYQCIHRSLDTDVSLSDKSRDALENVAGLIELSVPDLTDRLSQENQQGMKFNM